MLFVNCFFQFFKIYQFSFPYSFNWCCEDWNFNNFLNLRRLLYFSSFSRIRGQSESKIQVIVKWFSSCYCIQLSHQLIIFTYFVRLRSISLSIWYHFSILHESFHLFVRKIVFFKNLSKLMFMQFIILIWVCIVIVIILFHFIHN